MKLNKIVKLASILSRFVEKSTTQKKHVAAIIENGKIQYIRSNAPGIHAEYMSYLSYISYQLKCKNCKYKPYKNIKISKTLLVIRYENGLFKNSKPCKECIEKLRCNVKKIIYSTGDQSNPFICEKLSELENSWQSNLVKKVKDRVYSK